MFLVERPQKGLYFDDIFYNYMYSKHENNGQLQKRSNRMSSTPLRSHLHKMQMITSMFFLCLQKILFNSKETLCFIMNLISSRANATNNNAYNCYYWHDQEVRIWSRHSDHWGRGTSPSPTGCRSCSASVHIWIDVLKGFKILKLQQIILIMSLNEI